MEKKWWNQPMTRKNWGVVYLICLVITVIYCGGVYIWYRWTDLKESLNTMIRAINGKFRKSPEIHED